MNHGKKDIIDTAKKVLELAVEGLNDLKEYLNEEFISLIQILNNTNGRIICSGIGKSGHIARKISSSLCSIGSSSIFIHPTEAVHGDLGMIKKEDILIVFSNSGETSELDGILEYSKNLGIFIIAITRNNNSKLQHICNYHVVLPNTPEASALNIPSTSITITTVFWDCIIIALHKIKNFDKENFKRLHPGGNLGNKLRKVKEIMHKNFPYVHKDSLVIDSILEMSKKSFGCTCVIDNNNHIKGIITDGDLRRNSSKDFRNIKSYQIMNSSPITITKDVLIMDAMELLNTKKITQLFIVENNTPIGIIHIHDLARCGAF